MYRSPFSCASRMTASFGQTGKYWKNGHTGEDYVVTGNDWSLYAIDDGTITENAYQANGYGNYIAIVLPDGKATRYAHMQEKCSLPIGTIVKKGQKVGVAGATGNVTGRHLHIEIIKDGKDYLKPSDYINFNDFSASGTQNNTTGGFDVKTWKNGSTNENVYQTTTDCKAGLRKIGTIWANATEECYGIVDGCYIVAYTVDGTTAKKVGFVKYAGGVK